MNWPFFNPQPERNAVFIPENIRIEFVLSLSPGVQSLLDRLVDQQDDRKAAALLSAETRDTTEAMKAAIPST